MLHWDDLKTILALVERGSLAAAGEALGLTYTTVARRIKRAEEMLGEPLFERLADGYVPNEAARLIAEEAASMRASEDSMMRRLAGRDDRLSGELVITAPQLLIAHVLAPTLKTFSDNYPQVALRIRASNDILDLSRREADLAIRISRDPGDTLKGLRLSPQHAGAFASQDWVDRLRDDPQAPQDWIVFEGLPDLPKSVREAYPMARVRYRFDDMSAMAGAAQAGLGIVKMPLFLGRSLSGLVPVPVMTPVPYADVWIVGHPDVWNGAKPRAFRDQVVSDLRASRALFVA